MSNQRSSVHAGNDPEKPFYSETHEMRAFTTFAALFAKIPNRINIHHYPTDESVG